MRPFSPTKSGEPHFVGQENAMSKQVRQAERSETVKAISVADYIVDRLAAEGIDHCFGVAGDYVFPICDAVDNSAKVKWIGCANELNAVLRR